MTRISSQSARGIFFLLLLVSAATAQQRIRELTPTTASAIDDDTAVLFGVDKTDIPGTRSLSLEELKKTGVQVFNVKQYGATGDNSTDDTAAIQAACDAAEAASPVGSTGSRPAVYLPPGRYIVTDTIDIQDNIMFVGAGRNSTIIKFQPTAGSKPCLQMSDATPYHYFGDIRDMTISVPSTVTYDFLTGIKLKEATRTLIFNVFVNMDGLSTKDHVGIEVDGQEQIRIENCSLLCPVGIYISSSTDNSAFRNITYLSSSTGTGATNTYPFAAIWVAATADLQRLVCDGHQTCVKKHHYFYYANASGATAHGASFHNVRTESGPDSSKYEVVCNGANVVRNLSFHNCRWQSNQKGFDCNNVDSLLVSGNRFEQASVEVLKWRGTGGLLFDDACSYNTGCTADISGAYKSLTLTGLRGSQSWPVGLFSGTTSPAISGNFLRYNTSNSIGTTITTLSTVNLPRTGQVFTIDVNDNNTTFTHTAAGTAGTMKLNGSVNFSPTSGGTLTLYYNGTYFKEVARSAF